MGRGAELAGSEVVHLLTLGPAPYAEEPAWWVASRAEQGRAGLCMGPGGGPALLDVHWCCKAAPHPQPHAADAHPRSQPHSCC